MRILTGDDVRSAVSMADAIDAVRDGFIALSTGRATAPLRGVLKTDRGITLTMPAHINGHSISTVKVVSVFPENTQSNLPTINAVVLVVSAETGVPLVLMDGAILTALRTGAASGLATDLLAKPEATVLGVIGAGVQARTQVEAVCTVRQIKRIHLFSLDGASEMADELRGEYDAKIVVNETAHDALIGADVIVTATNSKTPVVQREDVSPGVHINGVGSFTPEMQEVAADVVTESKIVVDHRESIWAEAGDLIIPHEQGLITPDDIHAEIGELAAGLVEGRVNSDEITFFKSVGNAVQDTVIARQIVAVMDDRELGVEAKL